MEGKGRNSLVNMAEDHHAISGYAFILHGGAISWLAKWQEIISLSTTESEYVAMTYAAKEALWLCSLLSQLFDTNLELTTLFSDNQSAIALTKDHQYHTHTKHIDIHFHFICWIIENGSLSNLLPHWRYGCRCPYEGFTISESQAFHERTQTCINLRGYELSPKSNSHKHDNCHVCNSLTFFTQQCTLHCLTFISP